MPLDPQAQALLDLIGITKMPGVETLTPQDARSRSRLFAEMRKQMGVEPVHKVEDKKIPGPGGEIPVRFYAPDIPQPAPVLIYYHGGGWVLGDLDGHDNVCRSLANQAKCAVISVEYRLAPEAKFPAAVDDAYAAVEWVAANAASLGIDASRLAVGGDSAGGNLAAVVCLLARDRKGPKIIHQLLVYPGTDMRMGFPSTQEFADGPLLTKASMDWFIGHYLRSEADKTDPLASPILATNLTNLPPASVLTAECDPIRDEGEAYGQALRGAGVQVRIKRYPGMPHGFFSFGAALAQGKLAMADAAESLQAAFGLPV